MRDLIAGIVGEDLATGAMLVVVTLAIVLAFLVLFAIFKGFSSTGIRSSRKPRQARLAVMDAAIVDSRRRLVLVRRDDIEHLILIGGPTDVVVEQNIVRSCSSTSAIPAKPRGSTAPVAREAPAATKPAPVAPAAARPVPVAPARAPASPSLPSPSVERSIPTPSPQIRPATKPPAPQASMASAPSIETREPVAAVNPIETPRPIAAVASPPVQQAMQSSKPVTIPPGVSRRGRHTPVLAQASASTASIAASAVATPVAAMAASIPQPIAPATPRTNPPVEVITGPAKSSDGIAENQLADFEDNLAMNLGETLVAEDDTPADKSDLANEMDELLSEITSGGRS